MMRICRENTTNSFLSPPPSLHEDFSHPFHQTPCHHSPPPQPPPPPPSANGIPLIPSTAITRPSPPLDALQSSADKSFAPADGTLAGDMNSGEGHLGFVLSDDIDFGLMSCTESLGFESSDEISSLDFGSNFSNCSPRSTSGNGDDSSSPFSSSSSSTPCTPFSCCSSSSPMKKWSADRSEKKEFPPPLTTMSANGRRNFFLRPERKDGRLEIIKVAIERPEVLYASRQNGRLTMHLVSIHQFEDDEDELEEEDETEEEEEEEEETEERETMTAAEEKEEEEREWKIPVAGVRRCYQYDIHMWGHQQRRVGHDHVITVGRVAGY